MIQCDIRMLRFRILPSHVEMSLQLPLTSPLGIICNFASEKFRRVNPLPEILLI